MKKTIRFFIAALLFAVSIASVAGCTPVEDYPFEARYKIDDGTLEPVGDTKMTYEFDEEFGEYLVMIDGYVKNISDNEKMYASVAFVIYDSDGNTIGLAESYCQYLEAGATWHIRATGYCPFEPSSYKLVSLQ